jgi:hypothetical protein
MTSIPYVGLQSIDAASSMHQLTAFTAAVCYSLLLNGLRPNDSKSEAKLLGTTPQFHSIYTSDRRDYDSARRLTTVSALVDTPVPVSKARSHYLFALPTHSKRTIRQSNLPAALSEPNSVTAIHTSTMLENSSRNF